MFFGKNQHGPQDMQMEHLLKCVTIADNGEAKKCVELFVARLGHLPDIGMSTDYADRFIDILKAHDRYDRIAYAFDFAKNLSHRPDPGLTYRFA
jgi:hypothetical protein